MIRNADSYEDLSSANIVFPDLRIKRKVFEDLIERNETKIDSLRKASFDRQTGTDREYGSSDRCTHVDRKTGALQTQTSVDSTGGDSGVEQVESSIISNETLDLLDQDLDFDKHKDWKESGNLVKHFYFYKRNSEFFM